MNNLYSNIPIYNKTFYEFREVILSNNTLLKTDSILIFTCGARISDEESTGRKLIMDYADKHLSQFHFFIAENFFNLFTSGGKDDLLTIEKSLASFSDCIIIILESPSAFTELGAFTINDDLAKIVLIINNEKHRHSDSFINLGPIKKVNEISKFKPVINSNFESILESLKHIEDRLRSLERKRNLKIDLTQFEKFENPEKRKHKMLFILDLIKIFHPIKYAELISILKFLYGENDFKIKTELGLLESLGLIVRIDNYYLRTRKEDKFFYEFRGVSVWGLISTVHKFYNRFHRKRFRLIEKRNAV